MATITYSFTFSDELYFNAHPSASLQGPSGTIPEGAEITGVNAEIYCGVATNNYNADTCMTITDSKGNSVSIEDTCNTGSSSRVWASFGGTPSNDLDWNNLSSISLYGTNKLNVRTGYTATLTISYDHVESYGPLTAPTSVTIDKPTAAPGSKVTLSWSGAAAGENNPIAGYAIYRATALSGEYTLLTSVSASSTYGSTLVTAPATKDTTYYYRVAAYGYAVDHDSEMSAVAASVTSSAANVREPTAVTITPTVTVPGGPATLSWSGAEAGTNNAISGYKIYRSTSLESNGEVNATVGAGVSQYRVTAPTQDGQTYYFRVQTTGALSSSGSYDSPVSTAYATLTGTKSDPIGPTVIRVNGKESVYAREGEAVVLSWNGATPGVNNAIKAYKIMGAPVGSTNYEEVAYIESAETSGEITVNAPATGEAYNYAFIVFGELGASSTVGPGTAKVIGISAGSKLIVRVAPDDTSGLAGMLDPGDVVTVLSVDGEWAKITNGSVTGYAKTQYMEMVDTGSAPVVGGVIYSYSDPIAPTEVTVSAAETRPGGRVSLSWRGAGSGAFNSLAGYRVYRAETVNGANTLVANVTNTSGAASCYVDAPSRDGDRYYYRVEAIGSVSTSGLSSVYAVVTADAGAGTTEEEVTVVVKPKPPRKRRGLIIGDYDTALEGPWTLTGWSFPEPEIQTSYLDVPWRAAGALDFSTALTNGDPRYTRRTLTATLECSEGDRMEREYMISDMVNRLHGRQLKIELPDDPTRYIVGRVSVVKEYNNLAHAAVQVTANCEPWRYNKVETVVELMAIDDLQTTLLSNSGRLVVVPVLEVTGSGAFVELSIDGYQWRLEPGTHKLSDLLLHNGNTQLTYRGSGTLIIRYREARL